jgi:DNA-binding NarL/FixJ family response regulator
MIRCIVADDHAIVRQGLTQMLGAQGDIEVVAEAANHGEVIAALRRAACDVLLLDVGMPGRSGLDTLKHVKQEWPRLPVLMLSMYPEDQYAFRALKGGAAGYLPKTVAVDQLLDAIRVVARGRKYITRELALSLAENLDGESEMPPHAVLSDREFQTLKMIAAGRTPAQIGEALALSPKTVSVYRARVLNKLKLATNADLTRYALERALLD